MEAVPPETSAAGALVLEIGQLDRKYASLRVADPGRQSRLTASCFEHGQQTPVLVVAAGPDRYVLIDGYARVAALEALSRDVVEAVVWPLSEARALVLSHRLEATRRRSALEEAWLLRELVEVHGQSPPRLALALQRSLSWIHRRLSLVRVLPESVQTAVRRGQIPAHAAMKSLVPLARAKAAHCDRLLEHLEGQPISVRQMESLYQGWKTGDAEQRERLLDHPWLYLRAEAESREAVRDAVPESEPGEGVRLEGMIEALVSLARKTRQWIRRGAFRRASPEQRRSIDRIRELHQLCKGNRVRVMEKLKDRSRGRVASFAPVRLPRAHPRSRRCGSSSRKEAPVGHQEQEQTLRDGWSLQGFDLFSVEIEDADENRRGKRVKLVRLVDRRRTHICGECGKAHREGVFSEDEDRRWRDRSLGDLETYVVITPLRVACCGGTRVERMPWEVPGHRMTRRFFDLIAGLCRRLPTSEVAKMAGFSWETVCRVDKASIEMALGDDRPSLDGLRWIGVDEVSRTGGHVYFTVVTDLEAGTVVWIGEGKKTETLTAFFRELGHKRCRRIRGVISDLSPAHMAAIAEWIPRATHLLDRFHVIQWVNEAVDQARRELFGGAPKDELGRALKPKKWMLLRAREVLDLTEKRLLGRLLKQNQRLQRAYLLKENLRGIFQYGWIYLGALRRALLNWCQMASRSRLKPFVRVSRRIRQHLEKLIGGFEHGVKMGLVEAVNGKIAQLRRRARGYRDPEYFKLEIYQLCALHHDPWAKVVL